MGMRKGTWKSVLFSLYEVMTVWKNSFSTCVIDDTVLRTFLDDAKRLWADRFHWLIYYVECFCRFVHIYALYPCLPIIASPPPTACRSLAGLPSPKLSPITSFLAGK
jgi:hypothetical protein